MDRRDPSRSWCDQARNRTPELVPIRYGRMLASPFAFFRGAAAIMAADLADTPTIGPRARSSAATRTWRTSASSPRPSGTLVFDVNDFDETLPGPWEWDVKRLAASIEVAGAGPRAQPSGVGATPRAQRCAPTARRCAQFAAHAHARRLVRARSTSTRVAHWLRQPATERKDARTGPSAKARAQGQPARVRQADRASSTASRGSSATRRSSCRSRSSPATTAASIVASATAADRATTSRRCSPTAARLLDRLPPRRRRAQGRRRGQRRHALLDRAAARPRRRRPAVPAGQGGRAVGARALRRHARRTTQPRPARRRGPAADAGGERHLPRLAARRRTTTDAAATSTCGSCGTGRARSTSSA